MQELNSKKKFERKIVLFADFVIFFGVIFLLYLLYVLFIESTPDFYNSMEKQNEENGKLRRQHDEALRSLSYKFRTDKTGSCFNYAENTCIQTKNASEASLDAFRKKCVAPSVWSNSICTSVNRQGCCVSPIMDEKTILFETCYYKMIFSDINPEKEVSTISNDVLTIKKECASAKGIWRD